MSGSTKFIGLVSRVYIYMQPTKPTKTIDKNILMQPTKPTKTIDKTGREEKKKKSPVVITWILVCIVKIVRFSTFYFFYIL